MGAGPRLWLPLWVLKGYGSRAANWQFPSHLTARLDG